MNKVSTYLNNEISFHKDESIFVNATQMAKPFGKRPIDWLNLPSTRSFLESLTKVRKSNFADYKPVATARGGLNPGTWMHEDAALEFARWLSPEFAIWCNDRIKELMQHGMTALPQTLEAMIADPDLVIGLATKLKESRQEVAEKSEQLRLQEPKVQLVDKVFEAPDLLSIGKVAKLLGTGQNRLFEILRERKVLQSNGASWNEPYQTFVERGYFVTQGSLVGSAKFPKVVSQTMVTTKGLAWIKINIV